VYNDTDLDGIEQLQEHLIQLNSQNEYDIVCCGDCNARCGQLCDYIVDEYDM